MKLSRTAGSLTIAVLATVAAGTSQESTEATPEERAQRRAEDHFEVCDLDGNGWVSLREAETTLGVDRTEFRAFDSDGDGRMDAAEFRARYDRMLELLGAAQAPVPSTGSLLRGIEPARRDAGRNRAAETLAPIPAPATRSHAPASSAPFPTPADLLSVYDRDGSGGLSADEAAEALRRVQALLSADLIVEQTDKNQSKELELDELGPLAAMLSDRMPWRDSGEGLSSSRRATAQPGAPPREGPLPVIPFAGSEAGSSVPAPARRAIGHFERLDADGSGMVDARDLETLLSPARSSVRASSIVSALDRNGDGALDAEEFRAALEERRSGAAPRR